MICLSRPYLFKFFKGCLPQILLGPLLNTLSHIWDNCIDMTQVSIWYADFCLKNPWSKINRNLTCHCKARQAILLMSSTQVALAILHQTKYILVGNLLHSHTFEVKQLPVEGNTISGTYKTKRDRILTH